MNDVPIILPYGRKDTRTLRVPARNLMGVYTPHQPRNLPPAAELISRAITNPIGTPRLRDLASRGQKCVIIADDKTRPTPVTLILPMLVEELNASGIPDHDISVVFALGTHVPMTPAEMRSRMGDLSGRIASYNSEFRDPTGLTEMGAAPDGVRVVVDRRVAEADLRIGVGSILPHPECGWGGGGKILYPGVASERTVATFHLSYQKVDWNSYGSCEAPVRLNMETWIDTVGLDFIVNTVVTPDDRVYNTVAGHYVKAHRQGVEYGREIYSVALPRRADVVVITSFRADEDFWMASKAIFAGDLVIKDGGVMILLTPCPDGVGPHPAYADYIGVDDIDALAQRALHGEVDNPIAVASALAVARMKRRYDIVLVSDSLSDEDARTMKCRRFSEVNDALAWALSERDSNATVAVLPYGISTLPYIPPEEEES